MRLERIEKAFERFEQVQATELARLSEKLDQVARRPFQEPASSAETSELEAIKRKYRRAQADAKHFRQELEKTRRELAAAKVPVGKKIFGEPVNALRRFVRRALGLDRRLERAKRERHRSIIAGSQIFDAAWYLEAYPDVAAGGVDPATHYLATGWLETRDPGPNFCTSAYLKANPDVARSGINPLIHYIEHGMDEGRGVAIGAGRHVRLTTEIFDPPAPCIQFPLAGAEPIRWKRSYTLGKEGWEPVTVDGVPVGNKLASPEALRTALGRLERLAGCAVDLTVGATIGIEGRLDQEQPQLVDLWMLRETTLRTRWATRKEAPRIIRALQWTGSTGLVFVGEGLVAAETDFIDLELVTSLHPLLLIFATPEGSVVGADLFAFPSLCRGGFHNSELGSPGSDQEPNLQSQVLLRSRIFEEAWRALGDASSSPLLRSVRVDLSGSDGTGPLLQNEMQRWLREVLQIEMTEPVAPASGDQDVGAYLQAAAAPGTVPRDNNVRSAAPATLVLPADSYPTIQILVASTGSDTQNGDASSVSLICAEDDLGRGAIAALLPRACGHLDIFSGVGDASFWPVLIGAQPPSGLLAAIRQGIHLPVGARLLEPTAQTVSFPAHPAKESSVTVLISPGQWSDEALAAALLALKNQNGAFLSEIVILGEQVAEASSLIERSLELPIRSARDWTSVKHDLHTELLMYLGAGIVLHDRRSMEALAHLALQDGNCAASCPLLVHSRVGRDWSLAARAAGKVNGEEGLAELAPYITRFWNTALPVAQLPDDLWVARTSSLAGEGAVHHKLVLTTRITASYFSSPATHPAAAPIVLETQQDSLQIARWL